MNAFDGLLPPRTTPPPLPDRGGPAAAQHAARHRRRKQVTKVAGTSGAASLALAGAVLVRPGPDTQNLEPDQGGGASSRPAASASFSSVPTQRPSETVTASPPAGTSSSAPGSSGPGTTGGTSSHAPAADPASSVDEDPEGDEPSPTATSLAPRGTPFDRQVVADRPTEACSVMTSPDDPDTLCTRYIAPSTLPSGVGSDLAYELCARGQEVTLTFKNDGEVGLFMQGDSEYYWGGSAIYPGAGPHDVKVALGTCLRYTFHWDGLDSSWGRPMPPGTYQMTGFVNQGWTTTVDPGQPHQLTITE